MNHIAVVGLSVMGANLARNAARNGATVSVFNRTQEKTDAFLNNFSKEGKFIGCRTYEELTGSFQGTKAILLMVQAGAAVDDVIAEIMPHLSKGDILIDGGNSFFKDTERRAKELSAKGIRFVGMGVSGGEEGALNGPSMMPGGDKSAVDELMPLLTKMSADDGSTSLTTGGEGGKCIAYLGEGGAGHFVKMVHNGIEYGDMQLIAESYHLLTYVSGLENDALAKLFAEWNEGDDLKSFLIEITAQIFKKKEGDAYLVDLILDSAGSKGTGKWTSQCALDLGVMIPTITAAVDARAMSAHKKERVAAFKTLEPYDMKVETPELDPADVRSALYLSKICSYAQGMALIAAASKEYGWNLPFAEICRLWKGGCIIRSTLLGTFEKAFKKDPSLKNLLLDPTVLSQFNEKHAAWRSVMAKGIAAGVPLPAMTASVSYFDGYFTETLPQNLIQAQRDLFGAHTFQRTDKEGTFHADWN